MPGTGNMNIKLTLVSVVSLVFFGCASSPDKMEAAYVSPLKYKNFDCDQISMEMDYISQRTTRLHQKLKKESTADKWQMAAGLILFWPVLFALEGGDGPEAAEYSHLKGEFEALRTTSIQKKCGYNYSTFEKTITAYEKERPNSTSNSTTSTETQPVSDLRTVEPAKSTLMIKLPSSALRCFAPGPPREVPRNARSEEFLAVRNEIVEFQKQNGVYQDCLNKCLQSTDITEGNKRAINLALDKSVSIEASAVNQFNATYDAYKSKS